MYRTGIERLDQMVAEAAKAFDRVTIGDEVHRTLEQLTDKEETKVTDPDLLPCADDRVHDEHPWSHPDGKQVWCLGIGSQTMPLARTVDDLERIDGYPSMKIYVLDEDKVYELTYKSDTEMEWRPVENEEPHE